MKATPKERMDRVAARFVETIRLVDYDPKYKESMMIVAREIHAHSIYANLPLDEVKLERQLSASGGIAKDRFFKLAIRGDEVLGGFYGCTLRVFFCDEMTAKDMGWWVKSSARGGAAAILLLNEFEQWARSQGCRKCMIGQSGVENITQTAKLFVNCGYQVTGFNTSKEL